MIKNILFLTFLIPSIGFCDFYTVFVTSFASTFTEWDTQVNDPFLDDDDASYIHEAKTAGARMSLFHFENPTGDARNGTITDVDFYYECQSDDGDEGVTLNMNVPPLTAQNMGNLTCTSIGTYAYVNIDVSSLYSVWTQVDSTSFWLTTFNTGGGDDQYGRRAYLYITYTPAAAGTPFTGTRRKIITSN